MRKRITSIPVNPMADGPDTGIIIDRVTISESLLTDEANSASNAEARRAHREDRHAFFLLETGTVHLELDAQRYVIESPAVIYLHPDQVHRVMVFHTITVSSWAINDENLNPNYLHLLEEITPARPLQLDEETLSFIKDAVSLCLKFYDRKTDKLYHASLKDSCNALIGFVISLYAAQAPPTDKRSRADRLTKNFKALLMSQYATLKRPADYAQELNISTAYLNECVKSTTGYSVSYHIQERIILEAKRLLQHTDLSVKEVAAKVGYDDYPYFSRLFTKVAGMTALAFRNAGLD